MRGFPTVSALLAVGLASTGCFVQTSVHPFVGPNDGVALPALAGEWVETGDDDPDLLELVPSGSRPRTRGHSATATSQVSRPPS